MDPVEARLTDLRDFLVKAWQEAGDPTNPCAEGAAMAAAVLQFYREMKRGSETPPDPHWSHIWRKGRED